MLLKLVFLLVTLGGVSLQQCNQTPLGTLLQGCNNLKGLTIYSQPGDVVVDDNNCGDLQKISEFTQEPNFQHRLQLISSGNSNYSLVVIDPDAPNLQEGQVYLHMIRANIPGIRLKFARTCCRDQGNIIIDYVAPNPPPGPAHRYISLLYRNSQGYVVQKSDAPLERSGFDLDAWLNGKGLCGPLIATEFTAQNGMSA